VSFRLCEDALTCEFGWVFEVDVPDAGHAPNGRMVVLVNRWSGHVVGTTQPYTYAELARVYGDLYARNLRNASAWCLTLDLPDGPPVFDSVADDARRAGLVALNTPSAEGKAHVTSDRAVETRRSEKP